MANLPNEFKFKITEAETGLPINNLAVLMRLFAHKKNDYFIGPKLTNREGVSTFLKSECLNEIESAKKMFLMDYASTLAECLPKVSIQILSEEQILKLISIRRKNRKFWVDFCDCTEDFLSKLSKATNRLYQQCEIEFKEGQLPQMQNIILKKNA